MAKRKNKKQRTVQLMASAALLSTTVAPYVISAEELTNTSVDTESTPVENSQTPVNGTTGESETFSPLIENTIDKGSEITSSGGNTTTESIDNGINYSTTSTVVEATNEKTEVSAPKFVQTYNITLNFKNDKQNDKSVMDGYVEDKAILGISADGKKYVQMTIPAANKGWITDFKSTVNGQLQDSIVEEKEDGTTVFTYPIDSFSNNAAWVKVDIDMINYHHDYTVYLDFPNIESEYPVKELPTPDEVVEADANFTFSTGEAMIDSYMGSYIKKAKIVRIGTQFYADIELTGHTYAYTSIKLGSKEGTDAAYASNGLTGNDLVRTIRVPLDENKKSVVVMTGEKYDNIFTFDFAPVAKTIVKIATDLTAQDQAIAFAYSSATSWHAAAFPTTIKAAAAKAVEGKVQVTLQVDPAGLNSFTATQNGNTLTTWKDTSSLVTFTVDSLEGLEFSTSKTANNRTTDMTVNVDEVNINTEGALPVETVVTAPVSPEPEQPSTPVDPETEQPSTPPVTDEGTAITYSMVADPSDPMANFITSYLNPYFSNAKLITRDGKKYVQLTLTGKAYGFTALQYIDATGNKQNVSTISSTGEKLEQIRVIEMPLIQDSKGVSKLFVDSGDLGYGAYTLFFTFNVNSEKEDSVAAPSEPSNPNNVIITKPSDLKLTKNKPAQISFNYGTSTQPEAREVFNNLISDASILINDNNNLEVTLKFNLDQNVKKLSIRQDGNEIGTWPKQTAFAPFVFTASLSPLLALVSSEEVSSTVSIAETDKEVSFVTDSLKGISFEVVDTNGKIFTVAPAVEVSKDIANVTTGGDTSTGGSTSSGNGSSTGGSTSSGSGSSTNSSTSTGKVGKVTARESITYKMVSPGNEFITNYLAPYFSNAQLVTVNGKKYIELTLTGKAYGFETIKATGGGEIVSSKGEKLDQVRVFRFPAAKEVTVFVDSGDLGYGSYNLNFTFDLTDKQLANTTTDTKVETTVETAIETAKPQEEVQQISQDVRQSMTYTMAADPNGSMAEFITGYLAPYFSNAVYVKENSKEYVELTLTGKAYGFATLQYIDAAGKKVDIDILSSTGEKLDQVRVIRLPLVQDKDGITKIFVDSGDLGYGAYTLFFKFNVPAKTTNNVPTTITNPFKDIDKIFSKDDILALYSAGITAGTSKTTFSPNANITRAQFAVMVARALDITSSKEPKFKDVKGKWFAKEVQALSEIGITSGVSETKFNPNAPITRQQAAVMIYRMLQYKGYTNITTAAALNYKDNAKIADYAKEALAELQAQGIMTGSNGKVNPKANLTRAQMARVLKKSADLVGLLD